MGQLIQLTILLVSLIVLARLGNLLAGRIGLPATPFQLLIGALLGPSLLNLLGTPIILGTWGSVSPSPLHSVLKILAEIGLIQLMFFAGMKTDWVRLKKLTKVIINRWWLGIFSDSSGCRDHHPVVCRPLGRGLRSGRDHGSFELRNFSL